MSLESELLLIKIENAENSQQDCLHLAREKILMSHVDDLLSELNCTDLKGNWECNRKKVEV